MKYIFLIFFALVIAFTAKAGQPWFFGTNEAVNLTNGTAFQNGVKNIAGALDPSAVAVNAPSGSMYFSTSGTIYVKQDAGLTTNWLPLGIASTGSLTTINGQSGPNVNIATGSSGTDFNIAASSNTITLNLPTASASNRGLLTSSDYSAFLAKQDAITGGASTITTTNLTANRAVISNGSGKIAASATTDTELGYVSGVTSAIQTQIDSKEPLITSGTTSQYWRGDKSFQTLDKAAVGLANVDNTSDANKPVSTATQTALDLKADTSTVTALTTTVNGKIDGVASSVDSEVVLFSGTTGKASKRATGSGYAKLTSGVLSASANVPASDLSGQVALANGGTNKNMTAVNGGVVYTDADSQEVTSAGISGQVLKSNGAAAPTWETKNLPMKGNASLVQNVQRLIVPNKQLTLVTGSDYFAETGNKNILEDASFEGSNAAPSWNLSLGTYISDNSPVDGSFNAELSLSSQSLYFSQDSTLYASQFADGVQGLAMIRARTAVTSTPIYVCPTQAGSVPSSLTSGCVQIQANNKWGLYKIPFILGGTSNGIAVTSNAVAITGDVEVDDAFVGAVDLKQDINVVGAWQSYTPTFTGFGTVSNVEFQWRQNGENVEVRGKFTSGTSTATEARFTLPNSYTSAGTSKIPSLQYAGPAAFGSNSASAPNVLIEPSVGYFTFGIQSSAASGVVKANGSGLTASGTVMSLTASAPVTAFQNASSVYSASNADTDWASCGHTTSDFTGFGTVSSIETQCKREGADLLMRGKFTVGTPTATEARLALKLNGSSLTSASTSSIPTIQLAGDHTRNAASTTYFRGVILIEPSVSYVTFAQQSSTQNAQTKLNGDAVSGTGSVIFFTSRTPINGWTNSNVIIGTFNEVMTTPGVTKPKTCYYGFGGASATLASPTVCSTGTCIEVIDTCGAGSAPTFSATGTYADLTFANGTWANSAPILCSCTSFDASSGTNYSCKPSYVSPDATWSSNSSGGSIHNVVTTTSAGTTANNYVFFKCEGQAP